MNSNFACSAFDAEFHLRTRQALLASQHSTHQVALMQISLEDHANRLVPIAEAESAIHNAILMRLRNDLRESDTVMALASGRIGVLLASVTGRDDIDRVIKRLMTVLKEPLNIEGVTRDLEPCFRNIAMTRATYFNEQKMRSLRPRQPATSTCSIPRHPTAFQIHAGG